MFLPRALSAISDAQNALNRLTPVFCAETMKDVAFKIDPDQKWGLQAKGVTFEWEDTLSQKEGMKEQESFPSNTSISVPFRVRNIDMYVPRGSLVAVVGRVGSGKSSLLQGLIGEMRTIQGDLSFGGRVAYCPQAPWIQNASLVRSLLPFNHKLMWC